MSEINEPTTKEYREKGIRMSDYCEICDKGDSLFYMIRTDAFAYYMCDKCEMVSCYPNN